MATISTAATIPHTGKRVISLAEYVLPYKNVRKYVCSRTEVSNSVKATVNAHFKITVDLLFGNFRYL